MKVMAACGERATCQNGPEAARNHLRVFDDHDEFHSYMPQPLDSRQLRAFSVLARTGSFTQTAHELHLTQSAISHAMKSLESDIGCRLLDRMGKTMVLTQAGEQLLVRVGRILEEMVSAHQIDLAVNLEPSREQPLEFRPMFTDELQFIVSPLHAWARAGKVVREEIARQQYILYGKGSYTFRMIEAYFRDEKIVLESLIDLGNMEAIKELVKLGLGISILAPWTARPEIVQGSLVALPLGKRKLRRRWGVLHWRGRRLSLAEETFVGLCESVAERLG